MNSSIRKVQRSRPLLIGSISLVALVGVCVLFYNTFTLAQAEIELFQLIRHGAKPEQSFEERDLDKRGSSILKNTGMQVLIGIGVFAVLNIVVISVHHIAHRIKKNSNLYRSVEHVESPF